MAQEVEFVDSFTPIADTEKRTHFGYSIDVSGNTAVIGAPFSNYHGERVGQVFIYEFDGNEWVETAELVPPVFQDNLRFGISVALENDVAVVSSTNFDLDVGNQGAVFVYNKSDSWLNNSLTATLYHENSIPDQGLGKHVIINDDVIVTSSVNEFRFNDQVGKVFLFEKETTDWQDMKDPIIFRPPDLSNGSGFGISMDIEDSLLAVGAINFAGGLLARGKVYLYKRTSSNWSGTIDSTSFRAANPAQYYNFGNLVEIDNDYIYVGVTSTFESFLGPPALFVFKRENELNYSEIAKLSIPVGLAERLTVSKLSIHVDEENLYFGVNTVYNFDSRAGGILVYSKENEWVSKEPDSILLSEGGQQFEKLGFALAGNDTHILAGNYENVRPGTSGSVHVFSKDSENLGNAEIQTFSSTYNSAREDEFGKDVEISGNFALISSPNDDLKALNDGSVYLYEKADNSWQLKSQLVSPSPLSGSFGSAISIYGNYFAIADQSDGQFTEFDGAVFIYEITDNDVILKQVIGAPEKDGRSDFYTFFGQSLSIRHDAIAISARDNDTRLDGYVFIYEKNDDGFFEESPAILSSSDVSIGRILGLELKLFENHIAVESPFAVNSNNVTTGGITLFEKTGTQWISSSEPTGTFSDDELLRRGSLFGNSFDLNDSFILTQFSGVLSSPTPNFGTLYLVELSDLDQPASTITTNENVDFGYETSLSGNLILSSNQIKDEDLNRKSNVVSLLKFDETGQMEQVSRIEYSGAVSDNFGGKIDIYGTNIVISAPEESTKNGLRAGEIFFYQTNENYIQRLYADESGNFGPNSEITINIVFNEDVIVSGTPYLVLNLDEPQIGQANYLEGSGTNTLKFIYEVEEGDQVSILDYQSELALKEGSFITSSSGEPTNIVLPPVGTIESIQGGSSIRIEARRPTVLISSEKSSYNEPFEILLEFNKSVSDLTLDDLEIINASATTMTGDEEFYTISIVPEQEGDISISLIENTVTDIYGLKNESSNDYILKYDITAPLIDAGFDSPMLTTDEFFWIPLVISEEISSFSESMVTLENLILIDTRETDQGIDLLVLFKSQGEATIRFQENTVFDLAGNGNLPSEIFKIILDNTKPVGSFIYSGPNIINSPIDLSISFSEKIVGFDENSFQIDNAAVQNLIVQSEFATFSLLPIESNQNISISILPDSYTDLVGNLNEETNEKEWYFDNIVPTASYDYLKFTEGHHLIKLVVSEAVSQISTSDFLSNNVDKIEIQALVDNEWFLKIFSNSNPVAFDLSIKPNTIADPAGNYISDTGFNFAITGINNNKSNTPDVYYQPSLQSIVVNLSKDLKHNTSELKIYDLNGRLQTKKLSNEYEVKVKIQNPANPQILIVSIETENQIFYKKVLVY